MTCSSVVAWRLTRGCVPWPRSVAKPDARGIATLLGHGTQPRVSRHATTDEQVIHAVLPAGQDGLARQHVDHRLLEARGHIGHRHRLACPLTRLDPASHGRLET